MTRDAMGHDEAMALLPWLANDTLAADERERVERHVRQCLPCRAELTGQRALQAQVRRQPAVPISAERDFERLQRRIDAAAAPRSSLFNVSRRTAWAAAAVVIASLAAVLALVPFEDSLREDRVAYNALTESVYGALTDPAEHALIDVIFANGVTEAEMRALLAELGAEIIAGPSPRLGRYTLRLESIARVAGSIGPLDVDAAIERLQSDRRVRFASRGFSPPAAAQALKISAMSSSEPPPMQPGQPSMIGKTRTASSSNRQDPLTGRDASSAGVALQNMLAACAAILLLAGCAATRPAVPDAASTAREVLLTIRQRQTASMGLTGPLDSRYLRRRGYGAAPPEIARVLDQLGKEHGIERKEGWPIRSLAVYCEVFVVPAGRDVDEILARLRTDPRIETAQPMHLFETLASRYDDPYADLQPAALELGIEQAHQLATGKGVRVAVIDSAVDATHPELVGRIGLARDLVEPRGRGVRAEVHGTAVAGVIASAANNREGIVGIAPDVDIASLRACWTHPTDPGQARCSSFTLAQALEIAIDIEPDVINLSLAGPPDPLLERLLDKAAARGIVIVAAAPPVGAAPASFPSSHRAVLVAWSSTAMGAARVPHGLPAPADEIMTTIPGAGYAIFSGTSLAAAHLSGVIATSPRF